jgi:putative oxidoreductase
MKNKILFVVSLLFGLMFINAGLDKFVHYMPMPENMSENMKSAFGAFMTLKWLIPLAGIAELIGGILIIFPKTRALGAVIIFPVMVGILLTNTVTDTTGLPIAAVLMAINLWVIYENRAKYAPMVS